jgi:outer membrane protein insertion porin family
LFGLPREAGLKGSVFADAGTLFGFSSSKTSLTFVDDNVLRSSIGTGILWQSPIGPIRLDFAWPVTKGQYDETQVFRFVGGTAF